jgi:protein-L-isoaspartate(D-aspartate) O-methyltransferase
MRTVPREKFVPADVRGAAFEDTPLPIAADQTISQPFIVAFMVAALGLKGDESVLEIGSGSGYEAAILGEISREVFTIERIEKLAESSAAILRTLNYHNVHVIHGDGTLGWPEQSPFDAIIVSAGSPQVPMSLKSQLKIGGRLVIPVGSTLNNQQLLRLTRVSETHFKTECLAGVRFVPLLGEEGWQGRGNAVKDFSS